MSPSSPKWSPSFSKASTTGKFPYSAVLFSTATLPLSMTYILSPTSPCLNKTVLAGTLMYSAYSNTNFLWPSLNLAKNLRFLKMRSSILIDLLFPCKVTNSYFIIFNFLTFILFCYICFFWVLISLILYFYSISYCRIFISSTGTCVGLFRIYFNFSIISLLL